MFRTVFNNFFGKPKTAAVDDEGLPGKAAALARRIYENRAGCCAEAVLLAINETFGGGLSEADALCLSGGFCGGTGNSGNTCGALNGAVMGLGLFLERRSQTAPRSADNEKAAKILLEAFEKSNGHLLCRDLVVGLSRLEKKIHCADITAQTAAEAAQILLEHKPELRRLS